MINKISVYSQIFYCRGYLKIIGQTQNILCEMTQWTVSEKCIKALNMGVFTFISHFFEIDVMKFSFICNTWWEKKYLVKFHTPLNLIMNVNIVKQTHMRSFLLNEIVRIMELETEAKLFQLKHSIFFRAVVLKLFT